VHRFGLRELGLAGALVPGAGLGFVVSRRIAQVLDSGYTRVGVLVRSGLMGLLVVLKQAF